MQFSHLFRKKGLSESVQSPQAFSFKASAKSIKYKKELYSERENFEYPNMTLYEVARAVATDSYIAQSLNKYKEKIFKAGYVLNGDDKPRDYLKQRLALMSFMNETIFDVTLQEVADDLITFQNAYLLKLRVDDLPFVQATPFNHDKLIGGYIRLDPCDIIIVKDKYNNILRYELECGQSENKKIPLKDMIHFYMNRKGTDKQGTPKLESVLEDVKALRDIEGDVLTLIHRFCFPMYHIKVGLPQNGYSGTPTDIDDIKYEIESMTEDSMLVTNEKIEIKTIGVEGNALDMKNYLEYFEKRVFSGLNTSESQMGRDNHSTPDSLESQIHDSVKHIQRHIALFVQHNIYNELLLEGGFNPILNEEDRIIMSFNEISLDTRVKLENHEALKYESNIQTLKETRSAIGKGSAFDESDLYVDNITNYAAGVQTEQKTKGAIDLAKANAKLTPKEPLATKTTVVDKNNKATSKQTKALATNNRPQNQHGIYSVKIKESLEKISSHQKESQDLMAECYKIYNTFGNKPIEKAKKDKDALVACALSYVQLQISNAEMTAQTALGVSLEKVDHYIETELEKAFEQLLGELTHDNLNTKAYRVRFILDYWSQKYFWYCYCLIQQTEGRKHLFVAFHRPEEASGRVKEIDLTTFNKQPLKQIMAIIPPFHPYCQCKLTIHAKGASDA